MCEEDGGGNDSDVKRGKEVMTVNKGDDECTLSLDGRIIMNVVFPGMKCPPAKSLNDVFG